MNIACIILRIDGTIDNSLKVLKILKALKTENGPDAGIKETTTIIKSKTFHPSLKKLNLYTNSFPINSNVNMVKAILSIRDKINPYFDVILALVSSPRVKALIIITTVINDIKIRPYRIFLRFFIDKIFQFRTFSSFNNVNKLH